MESSSYHLSRLCTIKPMRTGQAFSSRPARLAHQSHLCVSMVRKTSLPGNGSCCRCRRLTGIFGSRRHEWRRQEGCVGQLSSLTDRYVLVHILIPSFSYFPSRFYFGSKHPTTPIKNGRIRESTDTGLRSNSVFLHPTICTGVLLWNFSDSCLDIFYSVHHLSNMGYYHLSTIREPSKECSNSTRRILLAPDKGSDARAVWNACTEVD